MVVLPLAVVAGLVVATLSPGVPEFFAPPKGPPDTLRELRVALPGAAGAGLPTRYLDRAVRPRESPRDSALRELSTRYNVTRPLARSVFEAAEEVGIDPELAFRLVRVESVFDEDAVGRGGALGLTQLMPGTARDIDPTVRTRREILEPRTNMRLGFTNLRNMIQMFEGDVRLGVIAYNRGEVAVKRAVRRGRDPENGYGKRVLGPRAHGGKGYTGKGLIPPRKKPAAPGETRLSES